MKIQKLIQEVFHTDQYKIEEMHKGYTNKNFFLYVHDHVYVLRIPRNDNEHIVHREHEEKTIQVTKFLDLDVPLVYFDAQSGIKITEYIEQLYEFKDCPYPDKIERCARLMKKLHESCLSIHQEFDPIKRYEQYRKHIKQPLYNLSNYEDILQHVFSIEGKHILCHNDWVSGNILFSDHKDYLIDYEYGADNDPLFDVMSFITENNIQDEAKRQAFYDVYFDEFNDEIKKRLQIWESFHNLLWCTWAMMMWEDEYEPIYKKIAKEKYIALQRSYLALLL